MRRSTNKRVRVGIEPNGSYGIDLTGTIGNVTDLRCSTFEMVPDEQSMPDPTIVQHVDQFRAPHWGFSPVSVKIEAPLCSTGEALTNGVTATKDSTSKVLEAILGGYNAAEGSTIASAVSGTSFSVTGGHGARFIPGTMLAVETAVGSNIYVAAKAKTRSTDALTTSIALGFTPAVGAKVLNAQLLYKRSVLPSAATSLQFLDEGEDRDIIRLALGCYATSFGLKWTLGQDVTWMADLAGVDWLEDAAIGTPQSGAALAIGTTVGSQPIPATLGNVVLTPMSGTTRTLHTVRDLEFTPNVQWSPAGSHNGVGGVAQPVQVRGEQPTLSMAVMADDVSWSTVRSAGTKYQCLAQAGNVAGSFLALEVGTMVLIAEPKIKSIGGADYWQLVWGLMRDENCDDGSSELETAIWRLPRF